MQYLVKRVQGSGFRTTGENFPETELVFLFLTPDP
jgi:hypothetical protein